ncbi:hypothetical protein ACWGE1_23425 [Streptomyces sp. NPDC054932]
MTPSGDRTRRHLDLPSDVSAAGRARAATHRFLHGVGDGDGGGDREYPVRPAAADAAALVVTVTDTSAVPPVTRLPHLGGSGGWGWILVRHIVRCHDRRTTPLPTTHSEGEHHGPRR